MIRFVPMVVLLSFVIGCVSLTKHREFEAKKNAEIRQLEDVIADLGRERNTLEVDKDQLSREKQDLEAKKRQLERQAG